MQEGGVAWDPVSINRPITPLVRIYVVLLLVVVIVIVFRTIQLAIQLQRIKKLTMSEDQEAGQHSRVWQQCHLNLRSLKRWSTFTLQASFFVALVSAAEFLREVANQKIMGIGILSGGISEICVQFAALEGRSLKLGDKG